MKLKKLIITGSSGFVGQNLIDVLSGQFIIQKISRIAYTEDDITWDNIEKIKEPANAYIHLAGKAHDINGRNNIKEYLDINVGLTKKAFESFKKTESDMFIYFSSVKASASVVSGILRESDSFEVDNSYGQSKRAAENYLLKQNLKPHQRLYILRPCMIHGPGNKGNMNLLFQMAKWKVPFPFGTFQNERSLLGVDNLNAIICGLINQKPDSDIFNLSDDGYISTQCIYENMGKILGHKLLIWKLPPSLIGIAGKIGDIFDVPVNSLKIMKLTENYRVSNAKIKLVLGWVNMPFELETNLIKTLKSFE